MASAINILVSVVILISFAANSEGQLSQETSNKLRSSDWVDRQEAYDRLSAEKPLSSNARAALIGLLLKEDQSIYEVNSRGTSPGDVYGEGYGLYVSRLGGTVQSIAMEEPDRSDVWPALVRFPYNPGSNFGLWLATHGDKVAPFLMAMIKAKDPVYEKKSFPVIVLAHVVAYERDRSTVHRLPSDDLQHIDATIRAGLDDKDPAVRSGAVDALAIMGDRDDLAILERIALTDPDVATDGGPTGTETRFFVREAARDAAERLRKRLSTNVQP